MDPGSAPVGSGTELVARSRLVATRRFAGALLIAAAGFLSGCGEHAGLLVRQGMGPAPALPAPGHSLIPTVNVAPVRGWANGAGPTAAPGLAVNAYARGLAHPRWLYVLPNGDGMLSEAEVTQQRASSSGMQTP